MATTRDDIHCPSRIIPTDYDFVGITTAPRSGLGYHHFVMAQNRAVREHMARTGGNWASHEHGGNCMSCGAHCVYMAAFHHRPSNEYIRTGLDCAEKLGVGDVNRFRTFMKSVDAARHHLAGKRKALGLLEQRGLQSAWTLYLLVSDIPAATRGLGFTPDTPLGVLADFCEETGLEQSLVIRSLARQLDKGAVLSYEQRTAVDIVSKLVKYGSLSERAWGFLADLLRRIEGGDAPKPAESPKVAPAPTPEPVHTLSLEEGNEVARPFAVRMQHIADDTTLSNEERTRQLLIVSEEYNEAVRQAQSRPQTRTFTVENRSGRRSVTTTLTDQEAINILSGLSNNTFALDLARQSRERGLSPRQWSWAHVIAWEEHTRRQQEAQREQSQGNQIEAVVRDESQMAGIFALFAHAGKDLKYPKIRLVVPAPECSRCKENGVACTCVPLNGTQVQSHHRFYKLSVAKGGRHPGWLNVVTMPSEDREGEFLGQVSTDGIFHPRVSLESHTGLLDLLRRLADNPREVAAEYGRITGRCCFCSLPLDDERSTAMGYGQQCASHYGLEWGQRGAEEHKVRRQREQATK